MLSKTKAWTKARITLVAASALILVAAECVTSFAVPTIPGTPLAPTAVAAYQSVNLTFTLPSTGGSTITRVSIVSSLTASGPYSQIALMTLRNPGGYSCPGVNTTFTCPITIKPLRIAAYSPTYFRVYAVNAVGAGPISPASLPVTPVASATVPGTISPPQGVVNTSLSLTITAPASTGGTPITSYLVTQSTTALGTYTPVAAGTCVAITTAGTCTVTGLTNGTPYYFKVAAVNILGSGPTSAPSLAIIPVAVPGVPLVPPVGLYGDSMVTLTITAPASDGGSPITRYLVTQSQSGIPNGAYIPVIEGTCTTISIAGTCTVTGLTNTVGYYFEVAAVNAVGTGPTTTYGPVVTPGIPYSIGSVTASPTNASVSVGYTAAATQTTLTFKPLGTRGTNPTTRISVSGGTWTFRGITGVSLSTPVTITMNGSNILTFTLSLNPGSPAGTYKATINLATPVVYTVVVH